MGVVLEDRFVIRHDSPTPSLNPLYASDDRLNARKPQQHPGRTGDPGAYPLTTQARDLRRPVEIGHGTANRHSNGAIHTVAQQICAHLDL
jgi:hypothetical protein